MASAVPDDQKEKIVRKRPKWPDHLVLVCVKRKQMYLLVFTHSAVKYLRIYLQGL